MVGTYADNFYGRQCKDTYLDSVADEVCRATHSLRNARRCHIDGGLCIYVLTMRSTCAPQAGAGELFRWSQNKMPHDIDIIRERIHILLPDVKIEQLHVAHPGADDDGLWFFRRDGKREHLQLESSAYDAPFIVETTMNGDCLMAATIEEAVEAVRQFFSQP